MPELEYLTPEEAATRLKIKPETVRDHLRQGKIHGVKVGRQWRIVWPPTFPAPETK